MGKNVSNLPAELIELLEKAKQFYASAEGQKNLEGKIDQAVNRAVKRANGRLVDIDMLRKPMNL